MLIGISLLFLLLAIVFFVRIPIVVAGPHDARITATGRIKIALLATLVRIIEPIVARIVRYPREHGGSVERIIVPTSVGETKADLFRPATPASAALPVHFHLHGGAFALGGLASDAPWCRYLAGRAGCVVINIDYVLAPHRTFPAPVVQCHEVISWAVAHAGELGIDAQRISIGGESAGGNLSIAVALRAIEHPDFTLRAVVPCVPVVDLESDPASKEVSRERKQDLSVETVRLASDLYVPAYAERRNPLASPLLSARLAELPPVFMVSAGLDLMHSDAAAFEARLRRVGAAVRHLCIREADHMFLHKGRIAPVVEAWDAMVSAITTSQQQERGRDKPETISDVHAR